MNNCIAELCSAYSKNHREYYFIKYSINGKEIGRQFIKDTELPYYQNLLK